MGGGNKTKKGWQPPSNPDYVPPPPKSRPKFSLLAVLLDIFIPYGFILWAYDKSRNPMPFEFPVFISIAYFSLRLKRILLWAILLYQKHASDKMRDSCTFIPSCSEYMFISIQKYGVLPGIVKGIGRLLRCRGTCNGEDWP